MSDKKELSKEDQEALERYNNYVLRMRKGSSIEISKEDNDKKNKQKETKIKVPEGTSDEDREALERYNNYVQGMNTKNNNKDFLGEKNSQGNSGKDFEVKITKKEQEKKEETKRIKIKAPKDAKDEDKIALERYNKFVSNQITNISKRKHSENNIFKKDISSIAWKIRLIFLILAVVFFLWALKDQMFSFI